VWQLRSVRTGSIEGRPLACACSFRCVVSQPTSTSCEGTKSSASSSLFPEAGAFEAESKKTSKRNQDDIVAISAMRRLEDMRRHDAS